MPLFKHRAHPETHYCDECSPPSERGKDIAAGLKPMSGDSKLMQEAFKGVIWPRPPEGNRPYKYSVVGVLLTDTPIEGADVNEVVLAGRCPGLTEALGLVAHAGSAYRVGDANEVLTSLDTFIDMPGEAMTRWGTESWRDCLERNLRDFGDEELFGKLDLFDKRVAEKNKTPCAVALDVWADRETF